MSQPPDYDSPFDFDTDRPAASHHPQRAPVVEQYGAPRRFGIGTILVVMGAASVMLAFLVAWGAPAPVVFHIVAFLVLIAFAQAFLYGGKNPRRASIVAGAIICPVYAIGANIVLGMMRGSSPRGEDILLGAVCSSLLGPIFGYTAGGIVGGVFLIMDHWEQRFGRKIVAETFDPFAPESRPTREAPEAGLLKDEAAGES